MTEAGKIISAMRSLGNIRNLEGMARYGINTDKAFGINIPVLREMARTHRKDHALALELWATGYHEARILASMVDDPGQVDEEQMESWVRDFNSWDLCDQCCMNLFEDTPLAYSKAIEWAGAKEEFIKRAGFVMMARLAVSDKKSGDERFLVFFPVIRRESGDERNFVKKAVNWALRQIGKRSLYLHALAVEMAMELAGTSSRAAVWTGRDALKELTDPGILRRIK